MSCDSLDIIPFKNKNKLQVNIPGSKSISNRALILAVLNNKPVKLNGILKSEDVEIMISCLRELGIKIENQGDGEALLVNGTSGVIPSQKGDLNVGNAGTVARFLTALLALQQRGEFTLDGSEAMRKRPMKGLIVALESHGTKFEFIDDEYCFPFKMICKGITSDNWEIDASNSSQIISAILLIAPLISGNTHINLINGTVSRPFVNMTLEMMKEFAQEISGNLIISDDRYEIPCFQYQLTQNEYQIEPDATAASYFLSLPIAIGGDIHINGIQNCKLQGDIEFCKIISKCGLSLSKTDNGIEVSFIDHINGGNFDFNDISDTFLTLAALSPLLDSPLKIYGIAHTRKQETDRVSGMVNELRKFGLNIEEEHDSIYIIPHVDLNKFIEQRPVEIETYKDHRFAMSFAILGSHDLFKDQQPWIRILDPQCCSKTFPRFFDVLSQCRSESR